MGKEIEFQPRPLIQEAVTATRNRFLQEVDNSEKGRLAFDPELHRQVYITLNKFKNVDGYEKAKKDLNKGTEFDLITHIGERFNVLSSEYRLEIKDGEIWAENGIEPIMAMIKRGRDRRKLLGSKDTEREDAEVIGFEKIQEVLTNPNIQPGTMMLSISPAGKKGSIYQHNFYDMFVLREEEGKRFIQARRYSSGLSNKEYVETYGLLTGKGVLMTNPLDAYFLAHPIRINGSTPDILHKFLHREHQFMDRGEFEEIIKVCTPLIVSYINTLCDNPFDKKMQLLTYNAILNKADNPLEEDPEEKRKGGEWIVFPSNDKYDVHREIYRLGYKKVRETTTGCGISAGFNADNPFETPYEKMMKSSPYSVIEFGDINNKNKKEEVVDTMDCVTCPFCKETVNAKITKTKIICPNCDKSASLSS